MSVINQLLLDLEKRRASGAERSVLPDHVRALPEGERTVHWGWIAAGGTGVAVVLAVSWALVSGPDWIPQRAAAAPQRGAEIAIERVVAATAGVVVDAKPGDEREGARMETLASRFSFELSSLPEPAEQGGRSASFPLPTAREIGRAHV